MASACVNNVSISPENFLDVPATCASFGWLSPRVSSSDDGESVANEATNDGRNSVIPHGKVSDPKIFENDVLDFEFRLEDPSAMLSADELFCEGKLVPLQVSSTRSETVPAFTGSRSPKGTAEYQRISEMSATDPYLFSPKAPSCSSRWKELLGLKKLYQQSGARRNDSHKSMSSSFSSVNNKAVRAFLHKNSKSPCSSSSDPSLGLPLLKESESSRHSLSSSSSGHDYEEIPSRLSLDSDKPNHNQCSNNSSTQNPKQARVRMPKNRGTVPFSTPTDTHQKQNSNIGSRVGRRGPSESGSGSRTVDSPRMNSSGKVVFQSLERSSSSPSSFSGGSRSKHRAGIERSYSANVRVTPVLNVPVCSLRGSSISEVFGFFSSGSFAGNVSGGNRINSHHHHPKVRNRTTAADRT